MLEFLVRSSPAFPKLEFLVSSPKSSSQDGTHGTEVRTPVGRRRGYPPVFLPPFKRGEEDDHEEAEKENQASWPWNTCGNGDGFSTPCQGPKTNGFSLPSMPSWDTKSPEPKSKSICFTPPQRPSARLQQKEFEKEVSAALQGNSVSALCYLLQRGGKCRCYGDHGHALHEAVRRHHLAALEFLLKRGVKDCLNEDCGGKRPLMRAIHMARNENHVGYQMARLLLEHGAQPNMAGTSPLHGAAAWACPAVVALLCAYGADPNALDALGQTPLHVVCHRTNVGFMPDTLQDKMIEVLIAKGADPTKRDASGLRPLEAFEKASAGSFCFAPPLRTPSLQEMVSISRLLRAERWWARHPAMLARHRDGGPGNIIRRLPDGVFQVVVLFL